VVEEKIQARDLCGLPHMVLPLVDWIVPQRKDATPKGTVEKQGQNAMSKKLEL